MLRLTLHAETDGTGELFVQAKSRGFRGWASAWFELRRLAEFATSLEAFPLPRENPPCLEGGFWKDGTIDQRHVGLTFRQVDLRGTIGIQVELASPLHEGDRASSQSRTFLEIKTDYAGLQRFAQALRQLAEGRAEEACLESGVSAQ